MKYFAKYLPVEGKIKIGDWYRSSLHGGKILQLHIDEKPWPGYKKVKLFLCSRDIYHGEPPIGEYIDSKIFDGGVEATKIIGEISPDAKWVVENQEFDESEISIVYGVNVEKSYRGGKINKIVTFIASPEDTEFITEVVEDWAEGDSAGQIHGYSLKYDATQIFIHNVEVRCPTCKSFH